MFSADTLPSWHGGHRCLLQYFFLPQQFTGVSRRTFTSPPRLLQTTITDSATAFIWVSCQHLATRPVAGDVCRFFTRLPQIREYLLQIMCNTPTCSSVSPADILLQQTSPVLPADYVQCSNLLVSVSCRHFAAADVTGTSCRLCAMLQPARQCLLQTFCCSRCHRYFLQIYLIYCHSTQQCILQAHHTAGTALPDVHGAHIAYLPMAVPLVSCIL